MTPNFALRFFLNFAQWGLIKDAANMEAELAGLGEGCPPAEDTYMIHEMWADLVNRPIPGLEVAVA